MFTQFLDNTNQGIAKITIWPPQNQQNVKLRVSKYLVKYMTFVVKLSTFKQEYEC